MNKELAERNMEDIKREADAISILTTNEILDRIEDRSFTWGFLIGIFVSSLIWMGLIYIVFR